MSANHNLKIRMVTLDGATRCKRDTHELDQSLSSCECDCDQTPCPCQCECDCDQTPCPCQCECDCDQTQYPCQCECDCECDCDQTRAMNIDPDKHSGHHRTLFRISDET